MSNYRYHIHVICVADDPLLQTAQDDLSIFFEQRAFLTKDLLFNHPTSANYSWRCINACDAVVMLVGKEYGRVNHSGVSQIHLSYTNARTKNKPMLILMHADLVNGAVDSHHLMDFVKLIEAQSGHMLWYFDETTDLLGVLEEAFYKLPVSQMRGWQPIPEISPKVDVNSPKVADEAENVNSDKKSAQNQGLSSALPLKVAPPLDKEFLVSCSAHAFKGGTLLEVAFLIPMTWRQILKGVMNLQSPFSEQGLMRCLNELIDKPLASEIVMRQYPEVHAVSRYQIVKSDVLWLQEELQSVGWLVAVQMNQNILWEVSANAKTALNKS